MPAYLCHGFRWQRRSIRVYVVVQNLDDASPEWIVRPASALSLLESFYNLFDFLPDCRPPRSGSAVGRSRSNTLGSREDERTRSRSQSRASRRDRSQSKRSQSQSRSRRPTLQSQTPPSPPMSQPQAASLNDVGDDVMAQDWSTVKLLEEYDPMDLTAVSRPYAYVADYAVRIDLSCSVVEEIARYEERVRASTDPPVTGPSSDETLGRKRDTAKSKKAGWFEKLRDQLQRGEEIRWYVVVNGDEERAWPDEPPGREDTMAMRAQQTHHAQYTHQQLIFEDKDANREREREKLRRDMGYDQAEREPLPNRERRPRVPDKELPPILTKKPSMDQGGLRPKTPKAGGFRRLFGRSKSGMGDETP